MVVVDAAGRPLGSAYMEPQSLICARIYALGEVRELDLSLFRFLIDRALEGREAAFDKPFCGHNFADLGGFERGL